MLHAWHVQVFDREVCQELTRMSRSCWRETEMAWKERRKRLNPGPTRVQALVSAESLPPDQPARDSELML